MQRRINKGCAMKKILVTGSHGVVGKALVRALQARGHDVWGCDLSHSNNPKYLRCDISNFRLVEKILAGGNFDYVYNLAAEFGRWNGEDFYETLWNSNVVGLKNIIRLQEREGFRLIHASSSEVYGDYKGEMAEEVMQMSAICQMNDYAISKWVNEMQIQNSAAMYNTQSVRFRMFNVYGPGETYSPYRSVVCRFIYSALTKTPYTVYLNHARTHTYIDDAAEWVARICDNFIAGEVYNITGTHYTSIKELSDTILKCLGMSDSLVTYKESERMTTRNKSVSNAKMVRDLGRLTETPFDDGIRNTIAWMKCTYEFEVSRDVDRQLLSSMASAQMLQKQTPKEASVASESTRTRRKNPGRDVTYLAPSGDRPPRGTTQWRCRRCTSV
jgi:dTDP-glucose 4,6-dehydratase